MTVVPNSTAFLVEMAFTEIWNTIVRRVPSSVSSDTLGRMENPDDINGNGFGSASVNMLWNMV